MKKYGDKDGMGSTLAELKKQAPLATTLNGVKFEGNTLKVGAILGLASVAGELIAEIEAQRATLAKFVDHFAQHQHGPLNDDEKVSLDLEWFAAIEEAKALLGGEPVNAEHYDRFAKLFTFEDIGQVLIKLDEEENGPEVRVYFQPKDLGVCSTAFTFLADESDDAWGKAEKAFALVDRAQAESIARAVLKDVGGMMGDQP